MAIRTPALRHEFLLPHGQKLAKGMLTPHPPPSSPLPPPAVLCRASTYPPTKPTRFARFVFVLNRWALVVPAFFGVAIEIYVLWAGLTFAEDGWDYAQV